MDFTQSLTSEKSIMIDAFVAAIQPTFAGNPALAQYAEVAYWEQFRDLGPPLEKILRGTFANYRRASPRFVEDSEGDTKREIGKVLQLFPSFLFSVAAQLSQAEQSRFLAKELQLAGVGNLLHNNFPSKAAADCFIESLNPYDNPKVMSEKMKDQTNTYLPRIILRDFFLIGKNFSFSKPGGRQEVIEKKYLTLGMLLIFLKYYFELINQASGDEIVELIDRIFLPPMAALKQQEKQIWPGTDDRAVMEVQIEYMIEQNKPPYFFKDRFAHLQMYHPLIRKRNELNSPLYQQELKIWLNFSITKLILFANMVYACKGPRYVTSLLSRLLQLNKPKFTTLADYLVEPQFHKKYNHLYLLIQRLAPIKKGPVLSQEVVAPEPEDPNVYPDIQSWGPYLQKFHQKIAMSGMLSDEELPVFFKGFAESALEMLQEKEITEKTHAKFRNTLNGLMEECLERSSLNVQEVKIYQSQIDREMDEVREVDFDERAQKIDSIGMVLCEASKKQTEYEDCYREALPIELSLAEGEDKVTFTVENLLLLPLPNRQKERFLETYVPSQISDMMMAIYNLNLTNPDGVDVTDSVYDIGRNTKLKTAKLIYLLKQSKGFENFAEKPLLSIELNNEVFKISIQDFFLFPLSSNQKAPEKKYFTQHLQYLRLQTSKNTFPLYAYEIIVNNLDHFSPVQYTQYFNIFQEEKLEEKTLEAVVEIWKNQGLDQLRA